jgi:hypothetical protein
MTATTWGGSRQPKCQQQPARNYGGFGLGLYVVRRIVERFGGHVECESVPNEGSTFTVSLPRRNRAARRGGASTGARLPALELTADREAAEAATHHRRHDGLRRVHGC